MLLVLIAVSTSVFVYAESSVLNHTCSFGHEHRQGNSIYGHVIEDVTEDDVAYAAVQILETGQGLNTDEYGKFQFNHLPAGEYTLRVQLMGYKTQEVKAKVKELRCLRKHHNRLLRKVSYFIYMYIMCII